MKTRPHHQKATITNQKLYVGWETGEVSEASELMGKVTMHYSLSIALRISKSTKTKVQILFNFDWNLTNLHIAGKNCWQSGTAEILHRSKSDLVLQKASKQLFQPVPYFLKHILPSACWNFYWLLRSCCPYSTGPQLCMKSESDIKIFYSEQLFPWIWKWLNSVIEWG